jgi:hypothetical protein
METSKLFGACAFAAGLAITLFLAAYLTPREWWRRPNLRALLITVGGAWGIGSLLLWLVPLAAAGHTFPGALATRATPAITDMDAATAPAARADTASRADADRIATLISGQPFLTHRSLNLRSAPGVQGARMLTVPAGATVTPTGARDGDWWQITARIDGQDSTGWASSLWLRRSGE